MKLLLLIFLSAFLWCNVVLAEEQLPDISKMSKKEINSLPPEIQDKLPAIEALKYLQKDDPNKFQLVEQLYKLGAEIALSRLMYFDVQEEALVEATKKFQRDIGEKQTGVLTGGQMAKLHTRSERISDTRLYLPGLGKTIKVYGYKDYVSTEGTWRIEGDKIFAPINYAEIKCHKPRGTCKVMQIDFMIPRLDEDSTQYFFNITEDAYNIISWSDSEVISQSGVACRQTIMTIDRSNDEVFQITRNRGTKGCDAGIVKFPPLKKPRISRLYSGYAMSTEFWENRKKETNKFMNTDFQKRSKIIEKAFKKEEQEGKKK